MSTPRAVPAETIYDPAVLVTQLADLDAMTSSVLAPFDASLGALLDELGEVPGHVVVTGDGDSFIAATAAELAFASLAGTRYSALSAQPLVSYTDRLLQDAESAGTVVVGVSASGGTARVAEALVRAGERGATTVALVGRTGAISRVARHTVVLDLGDKPRSPGLRTFNASCLALFLLAVGLGRRRGQITDARAHELVAQLGRLGSASKAALLGADAQVDVLVERFADAPVIAFLGSGPSRATAAFVAAKVVEASGVMAFGQDLEEWHHVERYAYPLDMPVFVLAPDGRTLGRALDVVAEAAELGRRVVLVGSPDAVVGAADLSVTRLTMPAVEADEVFSPVLFHVTLVSSRRGWPRG